MSPDVDDLAGLRDALAEAEQHWYRGMHAGTAYRTLDRAIRAYLTLRGSTAPETSGLREALDAIVPHTYHVAATDPSCQRCRLDAARDTAPEKP